MGIRKNYLYNLVYQILLLFLPLITVPYISRVLGSEGVGISAYTGSIVQYFIIAGTLGVSLYGSRTVAYVSHDLKERSAAFWNITFVTAGLCSISLFLFVLFSMSFGGVYRLIYMAQALSLLGAALDISWFFTGIEDFRKLVTRNILVRVASVPLTFLMVKRAEDVWKYVLILGATSLLGTLSMWLYVPRLVTRPEIHLKDMQRHLLAEFKLFIPQVAIQVYLVLNITMLGFLSTQSQVGIFAQSQRVVKLSLALVTSIGVVMLPRMSNILARGEMEKARHYIIRSFQFASYISIPMAFGWIGISREFVPWFFGREFVSAGAVIDVLSLILVAIAWSNVIGMQLMIPMGQEKKFTLSVVVGALVSVGLNISFISRFGALGAAFATLITEFFVIGMQIILMRDTLPLRIMFKETGNYVGASLAMLVVLKGLGRSLGVGYLTTLTQVVVGILIYITVLILLRSQLNKELVGLVKNIARKGMVDR